MKYQFTELQLSGNKKVADARAVLDLLNEHCRTSVKMSFSRANGGRANLYRQRFTIPKHAMDRCETYLHYYVIHEFTHCLGNLSHDKAFKRKERQLLKMFDITIDYAKAYPRTLYANGEKKYTREVE